MKWGWRFGFAGGSGAGGVDTPPAEWSELGEVDGGQTVAAGSALPATGGRVIIKPGAQAWVRITGTALKVGDGVGMSFEGLRTTFPNSSAQRRTSSSGPGAPGATILSGGTIQVDLSGSNADLNYAYWWRVANPVT